MFLNLLLLFAFISLVLGAYVVIRRSKKWWMWLLAFVLPFFLMQPLIQWAQEGDARGMLVLKILACIPVCVAAAMYARGGGKGRDWRRRVAAVGAAFLLSAGIILPEMLATQSALPAANTQQATSDLCDTLPVYLRADAGCNP